VQGYAGANNPFGGKDKMIENGKFIVNPQLEWTGGGWASTGVDLARWAKTMYEGKAFDASLVPVMLDGVPAKLGRDVKYGLGVIIRPTQAGLAYGHSGFFPGYMTDMMYFPEQKIAVAVQVNTSVPQDLGKPLGRVLVEAALSLETKPSTSACLSGEKQYDPQAFFITVFGFCNDRVFPRFFHTMPTPRSQINWRKILSQVRLQAPLMLPNTKRKPPKSQTTCAWCGD
jgi:hypothetical protein